MAVAGLVFNLKELVLWIGLNVYHCVDHFHRLVSLPDDVVPQLERLTLYACPARDVSPLLEFASRRPMRSVVLCGTRGSVVTVPLCLSGLQAFSSMHLLEQIVIATHGSLKQGSSEFEFPPDTFPRLEIVNIAGNLLPFSSIPSLMIACPRLKHLAFSGAPYRLANTLPILAHHCPNIESIVWRMAVDGNVIPPLTMKQVEMAFTRYPIKSSCFSRLNQIQMSKDCFSADVFDYVRAQLRQSDHLQTFSFDEQGSWSRT